MCVFYRVGRKPEAKDAARGTLKSPWWTLGCKYQVWLFKRHLDPCMMILCLLLYHCSSSLQMLIVLASLNPFQEVANIAEWDDEQIEYIKERVTEEGRQADLKKGKDPAQVRNNICMLKAWVMDLLRVLSRKSKMIGKLKERAYSLHLFLLFSLSIDLLTNLRYKHSLINSMF